MVVVEKVQAQLESLYEIECEARAAHYLVTTEQARDLGGRGEAPEALLFREDGDGEGLEVGLFLAPELLARVGAFAHDLPSALEAGLDAFCTLTEGVSHFVYLSRACALDRRFSLLEMEAQAEVDKFAVCMLLGGWKAAWGVTLHRRLFDEVSYRPGLPAPERWRYEEANRLSRNYCLGLLGHVKERRLDRFLSELRYTYRLGAEAKLQHLSRRREKLDAR